MTGAGSAAGSVTASVASAPANHTHLTQGSHVPPLRATEPRAPTPGNRAPEPRVRKPALVLGHSYGIDDAVLVGSVLGTGWCCRDRIDGIDSGSHLAKDVVGVGKPDFVRSNDELLAVGIRPLI